MLYKNWPADGWLWPKILFRLVLDGISSLLFIREGKWPDVWAILRAHFAFYGRLPILYKQRKQLRKQQTTEVKLYPKSVVWQYFTEGKKTFNSMDDIIR